MAESRRKQREIALEFLYQFDLVKKTLPEAENDLKFQVLDIFVKKIVLGVLGCMDKIDRLIAKSSINYEFKRLGIVDRNILRMAVYELTECPDIPAAVSINEAIELSKKFSTPESAKFVNGVLDRIKNEEKINK